MRRGEHPNSLANLRPFKPGAAWTGNTAGRPAVGPSFREWANRLMKEDEEGKTKYTLEEIKAIADAPQDDRNVSPLKRGVARLIVDFAEGSPTAARDALNLIFDRLEGRPPQTAIIYGGAAADPSQALTEETLERIRGAAAGVIADNGAEMNLGLQAGPPHMRPEHAGPDPSCGR